MASMGRRSLTKRAWRAQRCLATDVRFVGRRMKCHVKSWNSTELRRQARRAACGLIE